MSCSCGLVSLLLISGFYLCNFRTDCSRHYFSTSFYGEEAIWSWRPTESTCSRWTTQLKTWVTKLPPRAAEIVGLKVFVLLCFASICSHSRYYMLIMVKGDDCHSLHHLDNWPPVLMNGSLIKHTHACTPTCKHFPPLLFSRQRYCCPPG